LHQGALESRPTDRYFGMESYLLSPFIASRPGDANPWATLPTFSGYFLDEHMPRVFFRLLFSPYAKHNPPLDCRLHLLQEFRKATQLGSSPFNPKFVLDKLISCLVESGQVYSIIEFGDFFLGDRVNASVISFPMIFDSVLCFMHYKYYIMDEYDDNPSLFSLKQQLMGYFSKRLKTFIDDFVTLEPGKFRLVAFYHAYSHFLRGPEGKKFANFTLSEMRSLGTLWRRVSTNL